MEDISESDYYYPALEFDAPRFVDFNRTPYRRKRRWIEALLNHDDPVVEDDIPSLDDYSDVNIDDIDWFQRPHTAHEPSQPPSPPHPLITPVLRRVGLGSPMRISKDGSSSSASSNINRKCPLRSSLNSVPPAVATSPLRRSTKLSIELGFAVQETVRVPKPRAFAELHPPDDVDYPMDLSKSPSPPKLAHQMDIDMDEDNFYSRRQTGDLSNLPDLTHRDDELVKLSSRITTMRPQRVLVSQPKETFSLANSPPFAKRTLVGARLCPAPPRSGLTGLTGPSAVRKSTMTRPMAPQRPVQTDDIKRLLSAHNQRVRPRR